MPGDLTGSVNGSLLWETVYFTEIRVDIIRETAKAFPFTAFMGVLWIDERNQLIREVVNAR